MNGYMWPIAGQSKAERLRWGAQQNYISWAYMKELREKDKTCRIYDINPYIEVYQFRDNIYGLFNQNCDGAGDVWQYLIIGPQSAMLIDTAFGIGNIRGLCDEITGGMPLVVVNTHSGPDHCLGNVLFDKVYCHEYCVHNILNKCCPGAWDYLFDENGNNIWLQFDKKDLPRYKKFELISVPNHHMFSLSDDYNVELVWLPGHDSGHCGFLDHQSRILFAGDVVCSDVIACGSGGKSDDPYRKYCTVEAYRNELSALCMRLDEFDYIMPGHFMVNIEKGVLLNILDTLNAIVANPHDFDYYQETMGGANFTKHLSWYKQVKGFGVVSYHLYKGVYIPES